MKIKLSELPAFYINMEKDVARRHNFLRWNKALNFKNVKRIPGVFGNPYHTGLSRAFQNAVQAGTDSGFPFIIFEDDATPTQKFKNEIEVPDNADAVYLGVSPWGFSRNQDPKDKAAFNGSVFEKVAGFPEVFRVHSTLSGHAILHIGKDYALDSIKSYKRASELGHFNDVQIYFDGMFDKYNVYAIGPLFYQHDLSKPDVTEGTKNVDMAMLSGPQRYAKIVA
jgi:hypothetical protein